MELQALAERLNGGAIPTQEQMEDEARVEQEQIDTATAWLQAPNPEQRVTGAEQLSAYPTPEAEKLLAQSLRTDLSPEVRVAAAQSLDHFEKVQESTLKALLAALEDPEVNVRQSALSALETQYQQRDSRSAQAKKMLAGLRKKAQSPRVALEIQQAIQDFLRDQE